MSMAIKYGLQKKAKMAKADDGSCKMCEDGTCDEHADKPAPIAGAYAEGGEVRDDMQLVDRIIKKRTGEPEADFDTNDFDAMDQTEVPDDADYTGANSGDNLGNEEMDENDRDLIGRIMRSRAKKDRMPRPA